VRFSTLALRSAARNKRRTALTVVSLALALALFVFFETLFKNWGESSEKVPQSQRRLIVMHRSFSSFLPESHGHAIGDIPGVEIAAPWHWVAGVLKDKPKEFFGSYAVEAETFQSVWCEYRIEPRLLDAWLRERRGAIVGARLLERFGWKVGTRVTLSSAVYPGLEPELEILGTYEGGQDEESFFFQRRYLQELARNTPYYGKVGMYYVVLKSPELAGAVTRAIDERFAGSQAPTRTATEKDFIVGFMSLIGDVRDVIEKASYFVLAIVLLVVTNTMAMSVRERAREIAVLKALGFTPGRVVALIVAESLITALAAGLVGCVGLRLLFEDVLGRPTVLRFFPNFSPSWDTVARGMLIAMGIGVVSAILPALFAARVEVARGLRRVG